MTIPDLRQIAADIAPEDLPALVGRLAEAQAVAMARLSTATGNGLGAGPGAPGHLLTYQEAADFLRCSASYVETLVRQGKLPHVRLPAADRAGRSPDGRLIRLQASDLMAWAKEHRD